MPRSSSQPVRRTIPRSRASKPSSRRMRVRAEGDVSLRPGGAAPGRRRERRLAEGAVARDLVGAARRHLGRSQRHGGQAHRQGAPPGGGGRLGRVDARTGEGVYIYPSESDVRCWRALIEGPAASPFAGCVFSLTVSVPDDYPLKPRAQATDDLLRDARLPLQRPRRRCHLPRHPEGEVEPRAHHPQVP